MADYYAATLQFPAHLTTPEIKAEIDEYVRNYPDCEATEQDGIFTLYSPEARYGELPEIEEELVEAAIPFDRGTSADYGEPSFTMFFRPGLTQEPKYVCDVIDVWEVKDLIRSGSLEALQEKLAKDFPDFPPLEGKKESEVA